MDLISRETKKNISTSEARLHSGRLNTRCVCSSMMGTSTLSCEGQQDPGVKEGNEARAGAGEEKILPKGQEGVEVIHRGRSTYCRHSACSQPTTPAIRPSFAFAGGNSLEKFMSRVLWDRSWGQSGSCGSASSELNAGRRRQSDLTS